MKKILKSLGVALLAGFFLLFLFDAIDSHGVKNPLVTFPVSYVYKNRLADWRDKTEKPQLYTLNKYVILFKNVYYVQMSGESAESDPVYRVIGADTATFQNVAWTGDFSYGKDKNYVYQNWEILDTADPNTFCYYPGTSYAKDHNNYFKGGEKTTKEEFIEGTKIYAISC